MTEILEETMPAPYATHRKQLELILSAWGMPEFDKEVLKQPPVHITRCEQQWTTTRKLSRLRHPETMIPFYAGILAHARSCKIRT